MEGHIRALFIKFIIAAAVTGVLLFVTGIHLLGGLIIASVLTLVTYLAADLPFLPVLGRELTVAVDVILTVPLLWGLTWLYTGTYPAVSTLLLMAIIVAVGEWFFHAYALRSGLYKNVRERL